MPSIAHLPDHGLAESCRRYDERGVHCLGRCPLVEVCQCLRGSLEGAELSDCHRHGNQDHEKHTYILMHAMANANAIGSPTQPELRQSVVLCVQLIRGAPSVWHHTGIHTASDLRSSMVLKHGLCDDLVVFTNHFLASATVKGKSQRGAAYLHLHQLLPPPCDVFGPAAVECGSQFRDLQSQR